jgi:2-polyprenyl-6-methoxyphenol hydroxylase-like FAD-dependent oxidoreductase
MEVIYGSDEYNKLVNSGNYQPIYDENGYILYLELINIENKREKIAIIGGGPVGLFFAIKMCEIGYTNIDIYEPREYTRKQVLLIQPDIVERFPEEVLQNIIKKGCYVYPPPKDVNAKCYLQPVGTGQIAVRTDTLEKVMYNYIKQYYQNVNIYKHKVDTFDIETIIDYYDIVVSASGGRDPFPELINNQYKEYPLSYGIVFNFDVSEHPIYKSSDKKEDYLPQQRFRGFRSQEDTYYLGIQIGKREFNSIKDNNYENLPLSIKTAFENGLRKYKMNKQIDRAKIEHFSFPIIKREATVPSGLYKNKQIYLIGDSLSTTHFFSGMGVNIGFSSAIGLRDTLVSQKNILNNIKEYNKKAKEYIETLTKASKNVSINMDEMAKKCEQYTEKDIYQLAKQKNFPTGKMDKMNVCLSIIQSI